jgi:cobalt-zinc-cadmium efflux system membrane fusion protein
VADDAQAQAMLAQANAELVRARTTANQLGGGANSAGEISVRSPLSGVVLARMVTAGAVVESGAPLVIVTDPSTLWLTVNAPETLVGAFRRGAELRFTVPAYPGQPFTARIDAVGAGLDPGTRTLPVRAVIANGANSLSQGRLKPEMLASVVAAGGPVVPAVLVPEGAVQTLEGNSVVFLATPDSAGGARFVARVVETGSRVGGQVAITKGLVDGDVVVVAGAFRVKAQLQAGSMPEMDH